MNDRKGDPEPEHDATADPVEPADAAADAPSDPSTDRRAFMRQMSRDAVLTAGRLAGLSSVVRRSVVAAGVAATQGLEPPVDDVLPGDPQPVPNVPAAPVTPATPAAPAAGVAQAAGDSPPAPTVVPDPVLNVTPDQHDFLATGTTVTLAVNDPSGAPHLTSSMYHWDGTTLRLPGQLFTARATNIDRDPRVSLLVENSAATTRLAVTGVASMVHGDEADDELTLLFSKYLEPDAVAHRLQEMRSSGDQMVIRVRPTRLVWRPA